MSINLFRRVVFLMVMAGAFCVARGKPDIVLFIADDMTRTDAGVYGNVDVRTPNLDGLAKESLVFDRAFAASPTCTPSRSSIYTGLYPMRNGAHANHSPVNDGVRTLPVYMKELGYRVVIAGKTHIGPRVLFPFEYLANSNVMPAGKHEILYTDLNTKAVEKLLAERDPKVPLCLVVATHSPHVYWLPNDGYDAGKIKLAPNFVDTTATRDWRCQYYTDVTHMDDQLGEVLASVKNHLDSANTLFLFTADQGAQWPFGKWTLYDDGIRTPLLARWPGHIKGGVRTDAMVSLIDLLPTFMEVAGGKAPGDLDGKSILPVLMGKEEKHREEVYATHTGDKGMNRAPMRCVRTERWKYIANLRPDIEFTTHITNGEVRDGKAYWDSWVEKAKTDPGAKALVERYQKKPAEELYDIVADPFELKNLAGDPAYSGTLKELREKVRQWRIQQGEDPASAPLPEDSKSASFPYAG